MRPLTDVEQKRVEENMDLVEQDIKDCVHHFDRCVNDYDDLGQIGYIDLCKAVQADRPGRGVFSTYAYIVIRINLYSTLEYAARQEAELDTEAILFTQFRTAVIKLR